MTAIVALEYKNHIYMGSDSAASNEIHIDKIDRPKIIERKNILIGYSSSFRVGQVIENFFDFTTIRKSEKYLYTRFIQELRYIFEENGVKDFQNGEVVSGNSDFLVAFNKKLYILQNDFSILRSNCGYAAIGSGAEVAYGALYATQEIDDPIKRVTIALEAADRWVPSVAPPFHIISI